MKQQHIPALVALATALVALACHDQVMAPRQSSLRPLTPLPVASLHPKNSPDSRTIQFAARDTTTGATSAVPGFGFRVKWLTTYKATIKDVVNQVAYAQNVTPALHQEQPVDLKGTIHTAAFFDTDGGAEHTIYLNMLANDTLVVANRGGFGQGPNQTSTNPDGSPYNCGPSYPTSPCYKYLGAPGSITLVRLDGEATLTADSTAAWYNSPVSFLLSAASVEGQLMPITIDTTSWIPDADSLGGDWADASPINACNWSGPGNYKTCTRNIRSSGTLRVVGGVNGEYFEKTWHVSRTDPYPIMTATKYFVNANQRDTFTVRMSDNSPFVLSQWTWVADSGVAQTQVWCQQYNPCATDIKESGYMRARVIHNYVYKYTRAHVTVGPPPDLKVDPVGATVLLGEPITFSTRADSGGAAPYSITGWSFRGTPITSCGTAKVCEFSPPYSGRLRVHGMVDGKPDTAFAALTVTLGDDDEGVSGVTADSAVVSVLSVSSEGGVTMSLAPMKYVFPKDTVVNLSVVASLGFVNPLTLLDDTLTTNTRAVAMAQSHTVVAAARPDYLANAEIAALANRIGAMVKTDWDKRGAYASLLQHYLNVARTTSIPHADSTFEIAHLMGVDSYGSDSAKMRAMDEFLGGTVFYVVKSGDTLVVRYSPPPMAALQAANVPMARDVSVAGKPFRIGFVNGVLNTANEAEANKTLLANIVMNQFPTASALGDTIVEMFYNPTFFTQLEQTPPIACLLRYQAAQPYFGGLQAMVIFGLCKGATVARMAREHDVREAQKQRQFALRNLPPPKTAYVEELAKRIRAIQNTGRSVVVVAHSQGAMVARDAFYELSQDQTLNTSSVCTAILALASPIPLSAYDAVIQRKYVRALTARRDVLDYLGRVDSNIDQFNSANTLQADWEVNALSGHHVAAAWKELTWAFKVHEVGPNFFEDAAGAAGVALRLNELFTECTTP